MRVLVTGATGYIGGRLVPELLAAGHEVRALARNPAKLGGAPWRDQAEVVAGDVSRPETLAAACAGVDAVYYLVHSIGGSRDWEARDREAAANVRDATADAGVEQLVYLGGLGEATDGLSAHLRSRHEVGAVLASGPVPVTELRAAVVIGSGSASFEMLRYLVEVLPVMVTPRWVDSRCQPIAVRDVLAYLVGVLGRPEAVGRILEIGGPDVLTYREMMHGYAEEAGLRRRIIVPVPVLSPGLSSRWVGLVTPLPLSLARPLVSSRGVDVVVRDPASREIVPRDLLGYREAVRRALGKIEALDVATRWDRAELRDPEPDGPIPTDPDWSGGTLFRDEQRATTTAPPAAVHRVLTGLGGARGWYSGEWMWELRGVLDKLVGGPGMRRGRRHPDLLAVGDPVDFWRTHAVEAPRLLRLRAEMRLPGDAWLQWQVEPDGSGSTVVQQAVFVPRGLWGRLYWCAVAPFHRFVFGPMLRGIVAEAERIAAADPPTATARAAG
jgi:uncharacterized protein YbjT (DUF2867 family)